MPHKARNLLANPLLLITFLLYLVPVLNTDVQADLSASLAAASGSGTFTARDDKACFDDTVKGDVNGDHMVNILDAMSAINLILNDGCRTMTGSGCRPADCNADYLLDISDVIGIVNVILKTGTCSPDSLGWTMPAMDGVILSLAFSDGILIDTALAGEIQFHLNIARQVSERIQDIHARPPYVLNELLVKSDAPWSDAWPESLYTGFEPIDSLLRAHHAVKVLDENYSWYLLQFSQPLNMENLAEVFRQEHDVLYAEPNYYGGDGDRIVANPIQSGWSFVFSVGWGDCLSGCIDRHYWKVHVQNDVVELVREWGDPLP